MRTDIIIPLGTGSKWNNNELKYCLRSLEKYGENIGDIYIIGERPDFLNYNVIQHRNIEDKHSHEGNIWTKLMVGCTIGHLDDDFLYVMDDFVFLQPFDISKYPNVANGRIEDERWCYIPTLVEKHTNPYFRMCKRTGTILREQKKDTYYYDLHRPLLINKEKFLGTYKQFKSEIYSLNSILVKSTYCNFNEIKPDFHINDNLIKDAIEIDSNILDLDMFSYKDSAVTNRLIKYLEITFPNKSQYEL